jgi:hypothetical protein
VVAPSLIGENAERMKRITWAALLALLLVVSSCPNTTSTPIGNQMSPPSWIQGTWEYAKQDIIGWAPGWAYPPTALVNQWTFSSDDVVSIDYSVTPNSLIDWKTNGNETTDQSAANTYTMIQGNNLYVYTFTNGASAPSNLAPPGTVTIVWTETFAGAPYGGAETMYKP